MVGIVFVHGIVGNNRIFDSLKTFVPQGCETRYVMLQGHGSDALAFSRASMSQWKSQVGSAIAELRERCDRIIGVGHSMGCLLLLDQAAQGHLAGLFLLNPPLCIRPRLSMLNNAIRVATGRTKNRPVANAAKEAYGISIDYNPLHYYGWLGRYLELFKEIRHTKNSVLANVECPVVAILSAHDEMVSTATEKILKRLPQVIVNVLPDSTHYYYTANDREIIHHAFTNMLSHSSPFHSQTNV